MNTNGTNKTICVIRVNSWLISSMLTDDAKEVW